MDNIHIKIYCYSHPGTSTQKITRHTIDCHEQNIDDELNSLAKELLIEQGITKALGP